jgi:hypothetical protein
MQAKKTAEDAEDAAEHRNRKWGTNSYTTHRETHFLDNRLCDPVFD